MAYLLVISIFAFFHFILGHDFNLIEIWVQENIWVVIVISKMISFSILYQYYKVQNFGNSLVQYYFIRSFEPLSRSFYVVLVFLLIFALNELKPQWNEDWSLSAMVIHFVGHSFYFATDFFLVSYLAKKNPLSSRGDTFYTVFLSCLIFGVLGQVLIPSKEDFTVFFVFEFFLMIFFYLSQKSWVASLWVLFLFNNMLGIFFGLDMFYQEDIGPFVCQGELGIPQMVLAVVAGFVYLRWRPLRKAVSARSLTKV